MLKLFEQPRNTSLLAVGATDTLRLSSKAFLKSKSPSFKGWGTNLQNIEKSLRILYWADKGYKLAQADQAGAEALVVAFLCKHGRYRDLFLNGVKSHVFVAMHNFLDIWKTKLPHLDLDLFINTPVAELKLNPDWQVFDELIKESDKWPAEERYYYIAKMICHSSNYGITPNELRLNILKKSDGVIVLTQQQGVEYLMNYHALFPEIHEWHSVVERQVKETGILFNLQGDPLTCTQQYTPRYLKACIARVPQSTVGCITHDAVVEMARFILKEKLDWHILTNTHDSYVTMAPEDEALDCAKKMNETLSRELTSPEGETFRMKSEAAVGYNWAPKSDYNPEGLDEI